MFKIPTRYSRLILSRHQPLLRSPYQYKQSREISNFFHDNLGSLFEPSSRAGEGVHNHKLHIPPVHKVSPVFQFYYQFTPKAKTHEKDIEQEKSIVSKLISSERFNYTESMRQRPSLGSLVEIQKNDRSINLGIVISEQEGLFHDELTELEMIDITGNVVNFNATEISFHIYQFVDFEEVQDTRKEDIYIMIEKLLKYYVNESKISRYNNRALFPVAQSWFAHRYKTVAVDLDKVASILLKNSFRKNHGLFDYECLLLGAHMQMSNDAANWMVVKSTTPQTHPSHVISDSIPQFRYYSNSLEKSEKLEIAMKLNDETLRSFSLEIKTKIENPDEPKQLGQYAEAIVELMKHYILYPHPSFLRPLSQVLETINEVHKIIDALDVREILELIERSNESGKGLYDEQLLESFHEPYSSMVIDSFNFMREPFTNVAYCLPPISNNGVNDLAVSFADKRDYWVLQVHVLDIGSRLNPASKLAEKLLEQVTSLKLVNGEKLLFPSEIMDKLVFESTDPETSIGGDSNCAITFEFHYPLRGREFGWKYAEMKDVSLTNLENTKLVQLEDVTNILQPKVDFFGIFRSSNPTTSALTSYDENALSSIFKLMERYGNKRSANHPLQYSFPEKHCSINSIHGEIELVENSISSTTDYLKFLRRDIGYLISEFLSTYIMKHGNIPMIIRSQEILPTLSDSIELQPNRFSVPDYEALVYDHFTLFPNEKGEVRPKSFISGSQLLNHEDVSFQYDPEVPATLQKAGLLTGLINIIDPLNNLEHVVNQWQLINYFKSIFKKRTGYNFHLNQHLRDFKLMDVDELHNYFTYKIAPVQEGNRTVQFLDDTHWKIKWIKEQVDNSEWIAFKCMIMSPISEKYGDSDPRTRLVKAYCFNHDLLVDILLDSHETNLQIGDQILCTKIIELDYIAPRIVLCI